MSIEPAAITGLQVITMKSTTDDRGTGYEYYRESALAAVAPAGGWKQINMAVNRRGVIRGLHAERATKLVSVVAGTALGAYVELRPGDTPRIVTVLLRPGVQVLVPAHVLSGFQAVSAETTVYLYCLDTEWTPGGRTAAAHPLDPALDIGWPIPIDPADRQLLSAGDAALPWLTPSVTVLR